MLVSMIGTYLLLLSLSATLYSKRNSTILAGSVFAAQWIPLIFAYPLIKSLCNKYFPNRLLPLTEILSGFCSLAIGFLPESIHFYQYCVFAFLIIRGFLEAVMKSSRFIALKVYTPESVLEKSSSLFNSSFYLGSGLGGLVGVGLINYFSLKTICIIDFTSFLISAFCYSQLPKNVSVDPQNKSASPAMRQIIKIVKQKNILYNFIYLVVGTSILQGFHTFARTVIPMGQLGLGKVGVTYFQIITSIALLCAVLFVYKFLCKIEGLYSHPFFLLVLANFSMLFTVFPKNLILSLISYFLFLFLFEVLYTRLMNLIVLSTEKDEYTNLIPTINSLIMFLMVIIVLGGGFLSDTYGIVVISIILFCINMAIGLSAFLLSKIPRPLDE